MASPSAAAVPKLTPNDDKTELPRSVTDAVLVVSGDPTKSTVPLDSECRGENRHAWLRADEGTRVEKPGGGETKAVPWWSVCVWCWTKVAVMSMVYRRKCV